MIILEDRDKLCRRLGGLAVRPLAVRRVRVPGGGLQLSHLPACGSPLVSLTGPWCIQLQLPIGPRQAGLNADRHPAAGTQSGQAKNVQRSRLRLATSASAYLLPGNRDYPSTPRARARGPRLLVLPPTATYGGLVLLAPRRPAILTTTTCPCRYQGIPTH